MAISREQVRHIAFLARLALTPDEEASFAQQLGSILQSFEKLNDLDTDRVEPTAHIVAIGTPFRDDIVTKQREPSDWLANAPARDDQFFKVPKIIE